MADISKEMLKDSLIRRHGAAFYNKMASAFAAVAGLGGLGSNIAVMLARAGIGGLLLIDFDIVDLSNINRQQYTLKHIGISKTEALKNILTEINPYMSIKTLNTRINSGNIPDIFKDIRIVAEALDCADQKAMLINGILENCPKTVIVSGSGMAGYGDANLIHTQQYMKRLYVCGDGVSGIENGGMLMAPRVAVCAGHQANKIIQLIMEEE